jgi:hypothetical protein
MFLLVICWCFEAPQPGLPLSVWFYTPIVRKPLEDLWISEGQRGGLGPLKTQSLRPTLPLRSINRDLLWWHSRAAQLAP